MLNDDLIKNLHVAKLSSLGILTSGIAHEINNPLAVMKVSLEFLKNNYKKDNFEELFLKMVGTCENSVNRIGALVQSVRDFSKLDESRFKDVDFYAVLDAVIPICDAVYGKLGINIIKKLPQEKITLFGSFGGMQQVMMALINNSFDAMKDIKEKDRKKEIIVSAKVIDKKVTILVEDFGTGISPENMNKIFDLYFSTKNSGGIGLTVAKSIVEMIGGSICVKTSSNAGTTMELVLPVISWPR